jgi:uncharacterized membrane protein required for colicin V production
MPGYMIGSVIGALVGVWVAAYFARNLPDRWVLEWYGFPTILTMIFFVIGLYVLCAFVGDHIYKRLSSQESRAK